MRDSKFKKGDRVQLIWGNDYYAYKLATGDTGTVNENHNIAPFVLWDRPECNVTKHGTAVFEEFLTPVS